MTPRNVRDVSVVIAAYTEDRWNDLVRAVESVRSQTLPAREVIVVVDHNSALLERMRAHDPGVVILENLGPRGLSGARNSAVSVAQGEVIAFMDDDAVAKPDWLEKLAEGYNDPLVLGTGGAAEPLWSDGRPAWFPDEFDWVVGCTYRGMPTSTSPVRNVMGCNMSFRREVFQTVGLFRNGIGRIGTRPVGDEETEFCIRLRSHQPSGVVLYEPKARLMHRVPQSRARWRYFWSRCYNEGLSKALVTRLVGSQDGLAAERSYTLRTLPSGVARGLADVVLRHDLSGLARAAAIVTGLAVTTAGYLFTSLSVGLRSLHGSGGNFQALPLVPAQLASSEENARL